MSVATRNGELPRNGRGPRAPRPRTPRPPAPILVLGLTELSMHHGALGIVRSAGRLGIPVFNAQPVSGTGASRSRYSRGELLLPRAPDGEARLAELRSFTAAHGPSVLVAVDDAAAMFVADHAGDLAQAGFLFARQPEGLVRALASKREMYRLCMAHDIPTPRSLFPSSEEQLLSYATNMGFPIVAKRIDGSLPARGLGEHGAAPVETPSVLIAADERELLDAYRRMESPLGPNVMLQEYVPGGPQTIWMFNGYFDADSHCRVAFTGRKLRQSPPYTGATTLGVCVANATVAEQTRRLMKAVGYRGILDIGYRFDARDGRYKLLDVNPRIGATFRLFVSEDGMDVLRAMYLDLTGGQVPPAGTWEGRRWVVEPLDMRASIAYIRRGDITPVEWARSFRNVHEAAWMAFDDPRPAAHAFSRLLAGRLRRRSRRHTQAA